MPRVAIAIHGGAGALPDAGVDGAKAGCLAAAHAGLAVLLAGGSALDAVEAAVLVLEDNPRYNAGTGSALTRDGRVECDALIMEGRRLDAGSVTGLTTSAHPISVARAVMEHSQHAFLTGEAAARLAAQLGQPVIANEALITDARRAQLALELASDASEARTCDPFAAVALPEDVANAGSADHDTVGAVALDASGDVAAATSTGGITGKLPGRVGDCPLVGSGGYADNDSGAASTTGTGEFILRFCLASKVCALAGGGSAQEAVRGALQAMKRRMPEDPGEGVIFVTAGGDVGIGHSTPRMSWAAASAEAGTGAAARTACGVTASEAPDAEGVFAGAPLA